MPTPVLDKARAVREAGLFAAVGAQREGLGLADLGVLEVKGPEAARFLHGQVTNEVEALRPGEGNLSARVTRTGTLTRLFSLHRLPESKAEPSAFWLILERDGVPGLREDLEQFCFEDAALTDISERLDWVLLQGPRALAAAEDLFGTLGRESWEALPEHAIRILERPGLPPGSCAVARALIGDAGALVAIPREADMLGLVAEHAEAAIAKHGLVRLAGADLGEVLEVLRVEAGVVRRGVDFEAEKRVLPETGIERQVVSYSKGCFLGQEVIARIRTYGSTPSALRGLVFEGGAEVLAELPAPGAALLLESGQKIGEIASRTFSPVMDAPVAYAYLGRQHRTPGTKLIVKGRDQAWPASVALLPFYHAPNRAARARFLHEKAIRFFSIHKDDEAVRLLEEALRHDPHYADAYEALGVILGRGARFDEAIEIFKRLEEVAPDEPMVHTNLSLFYMKQGNKEKAELEKAKAASKAFGQIAGDAEAARRAEAESAQRRADAERKMAMFQEVLEIDPEDPVALFGLSNACLQLDQTERAAETFAKAAQAQKDNSAVYAAWGKALEALGRADEAAAVYKQGIEVASTKGDLMPLKEMEQRMLLLRRANG